MASSAEVPPPGPELSFPTSFYAPSQQKAIEAMREARFRLKALEEMIKSTPLTEDGCRQVFLTADETGYLCDLLERAIRKSGLDQAPQGGTRPELSDAQRDGGLGKLSTLPGEIIDACLAHLDRADLARLCLVSHAVNQRALPILMGSLVFTSKKSVDCVKIMLQRMEWNGASRLTSLRVSGDMCTEEDVLQIMLSWASVLQKLDWTMSFSDGFTSAMPQLKHLVLVLSSGLTRQVSRRGTDPLPEYSWNTMLQPSSTSLRTVHLTMDFKDDLDAGPEETGEVIYDLSALFKQRDLLAVTLDTTSYFAHVDLRLWSLQTAEPLCHNLRDLAIKSSYSYRPFNNAFRIETSQLCRILHSTPRLARLLLDVQLAPDDPILNASSFPVLPSLKRVEVNVNLMAMIPRLATSGQLESLTLLGSRNHDEHGNSPIQEGARLWGKWGHAFLGALHIEASLDLEDALALCEQITPLASHLMAAAVAPTLSNTVLASLVSRLRPFSPTLKTCAISLHFTCDSNHYRPYRPKFDTSDCDLEHEVALAPLFQALPSLARLHLNGHYEFYERRADPTAGVACRLVPRAMLDSREENDIFELWPSMRPPK